jgi:hypothetical protein
MSAIQQVLASYGGAGFPFTDVKFLLHMNGSNGGTTFTDSSSFARTVSVSAAVTTSTTQVKYGSAAAAFSNGTGRLSIAHSADLVPGAANFTLEGWVWPSQTISGANRMICCKMTGTGHRSYALELSTAGYLTATASNAAGSSVYVSLAASGANTIPAAQWSHCAFVRFGNVWMLFLNGALMASATVSGAAYSNASDSVHIGNTSTGGSPLFATATHYLDDLRLVNGYAVYTSAFTPPSSELPDS